MRLEKAIVIAAAARRPKRKRVVPQVRDDADTTIGRDLGTGRFVVGWRGGGRPMGSRNLLTQALLDNLAEDWHRHGPMVLAQLRWDDPASYVRIFGNVVERLTPMVDDDEINDAAAVADEIKQARSRDQLIELVRARGGARAFEGFKRLVALLDEYPELKGVIYR
jgi:hypothetical protein